MKGMLTYGVFEVGETCAGKHFSLAIYSRSDSKPFKRFSSSKLISSAIAHVGFLLAAGLEEFMDIVND